jgi:hypothetical protein
MIMLTIAESFIMDYDLLFGSHQCLSIVSLNGPVLSIRSAFLCNLSICFSLHTVYIHLLDFEYDLTCLG